MKICIIGPSPKGDEKRKTWTDWKVEYKKKLGKLGNVEIVYGDMWLNETKPLVTFGHDSNMIKNSDIVVANAESKIGAGTAQEFLVAKYFTKPVITVLPKDSHHRRSNIVFEGVMIKDWIHPFLFSTSDLIVEKINDCLDWIKEYQKNPKSKNIKDIKIIDKSIKAYLDEIKKL